MTAVARTVALFVVAAALVPLAPLAMAGPRARVLVLGPSEQDPIVARLRRELGLLGMEVEVLTPSGNDPSELAASAGARHATAAAAVRSSPPAIVVWVDPSLHPNAPAEPPIVVDESSAGSADPRLLVLRAVEIVREQLLPAPPEATATTTPDAAPPLPSPPDASAPTVPPRSTNRDRAPSAFIGPALVASPGNVGPMPLIWFGARWAPVSRMDLELVSLVPTAAATVTAPEGSMTFRVGAVAAGVSAKLLDPSLALFVNAGAGLGAMIAGFDGQAHAPWQGASGVRGTMLPYVHADIGYWVASRIALRADVVTAFALPEPVLTIAGRHVATFGEPAVAVAIGVEVRP